MKRFFPWKPLLNMKISWKARMLVESTVIITPFILLHAYPFTLFTPFMDKHRRQRRATIEDVDLDTSPGLMTPEQVVEYYRSLGFEDPI